MRVLLYGAAALALAVISSPDSLRSALAAAASALIEATPFLFAGAVLSRLLRRYDWLAAYLGCGCTRGPSARSLPAAGATWLLFGPFVAVGRCLCAELVARVLCRRNGDSCAGAGSRVLAELRAVLPYAIAAGVTMQLLGTFDPSRLSPVAGALFGTLLGLLAAPCALGAIALAGVLRVHAPAAAAAFLCVAGILDLRTLSPRSSRPADEDAFAYLLLAAALAIVAWHRGDALVNPAFTPALWGCAIAAVGASLTYRRQRSSAARLAPALMLTGALLAAPAPQYRATETTLRDLFAGERLTFTGALARNGNASAIVRYAITCCRADAAPVAVRLVEAPRYPIGTWLRVEGSIEDAGGDFRLVPRRIERVAPPADPFIYL